MKIILLLSISIIYVFFMMHIIKNIREVEKQAGKIYQVRSFNCVLDPSDPIDSDIMKGEK